MQGADHKINQGCCTDMQQPYPYFSGDLYLLPKLLTNLSNAAMPSGVRL